MMFIPIGQSQGVWERPYLTMGVMGVCVALHLARAFTSPGNEAYAPLDEQFEEVIYEFIDEEDMDPGEAVEHAQATLEAMLQGKYHGPETGPYLALRDIADEVEELQSKDFGSAWAFNPADGVDLSIIAYAFVHGDFFHLLFNMLFLWLAGSSLEDRWGRRFYLVFYIFGAVVAAIAFAIIQPKGGGGMVGASGAIAACMGAFLVLFYKAKINMFYFIWWLGLRWGTFQAPAYLALPLWFAMEAVSSISEAEGIGDGVAHSAHAGGFAFGLVVALVLKQTGWDQKLISEERRQEEAQDKADSKVQDAAALLEQGDLEGALIAYQAILVGAPKEPRAQRALLDIGFKLQRGDIIQRFLDAAVTTSAQLGDGMRAVELYRQASIANNATAISERNLSVVVRFAAQANDLTTAIEATNTLIKRAPRSAFLPAAMWQVAELMLAQGHRDKAMGAFKSLATKYSMDPFGQKAAAKIRELEANPIQGIPLATD